MVSNSSKEVGKRDYRAFVGKDDRYDLVAATQFSLLVAVGLREHHTLLDIGCGSLRAGRLFIPYLLPGHYFGIEPEQWLIEESIEKELGRDMVAIKQPSFDYNTAFNLSVFDRQFDFMVAQSIFTHASQTQIEKCLAEARSVLKPDGLFLVTIVEGDENYAGEDWVYPQCISYTLAHMQHLAEVNDLVCEPVDWHHPSSLKWLGFSHRENSINLPGETSLVALQGKVDELERQLDITSRKYQRLSNHPYVKLGRSFFQFFQKARSE